MLSNCMRDKGCCVVTMTDPQRQAYEKLDETQRTKARVILAAAKDISSLLPS